MIDKSAVLDFLKTNELCVLATANSTGKPEAAVLAYAINDKFELFINTEPETRKYKNITENNKISVVVGGFKNDPSVQLDGTITELSAVEGEIAKNFVLGAHPEWKDYFTSPTGKWFRVAPFWARFSDFSKNPPEVSEMNI